MVTKLVDRVSSMTFVRELKYCLVGMRLLQHILPEAKLNLQSSNLLGLGQVQQTCLHLLLILPKAIVNHLISVYTYFSLFCSALFCCLSISSCFILSISCLSCCIVFCLSLKALWCCGETLRAIAKAALSPQLTFHQAM